VGKASAKHMVKEVVDFKSLYIPNPHGVMDAVRAALRHNTGAAKSFPTLRK
jgi:hypothetical protein